jgi:hypothetical protein
MPLPLVGMADFDQRLPWTFQHGWLKLTTFADPLHDLAGPTLSIDLDVSSWTAWTLSGGWATRSSKWDKRGDRQHLSLPIRAGTAFGPFRRHHGGRQRGPQRAGIITGYLAPGQAGLTGTVVRELKRQRARTRRWLVPAAADSAGRARDRLPRQAEPA